MAVTTRIPEYEMKTADPQVVSTGEPVLVIPGIDEPWPDDLAQATAFASEDALSEMWNTAEEDEAWRDM